MKCTSLGSTGLTISPLIFGTLPLGPLQTNLSPSEGGALIRHALESGITTIDTAALYGTFSHIRQALNGYSGEAVIASKTHAADPATAREHVETALREIGIERLDIVHLHAARIEHPFRDRAEVIETLLQMKDEGKIGHVGISTHYASVVDSLPDHPEIEIVHPLINRIGLGIIDGGKESGENGGATKMSAAIKKASDAGVGVYAMKALAGGNLISTARESINWVRNLNGVDGLALGMLSIEEIDANCALFAGEALDPSTWERLESRKRELKIMTNFCTGCAACVKSCSEGGLQIANGRAKVNPEVCVLCGYCADACPDFIIRVV